MSVMITTPAEATRLCLVADVRAALGITDGSADAMLQQIIDAASAAIEDYCGMVFPRQSYQEVVPGSESDILVLSRTPIIGTPVVLADGLPIVDFEVRDADVGFLYREVGWQRSAWIGWNVEPTRSPLYAPDFTIQYTAGYLLPGEDGCDLPANIRQACVVIAAQWYRRLSRDTDVASKKVGDLALTYKTGASGTEVDQGLPPTARALLPRRIV
jgi:uncharacterized phiE125 gp8 family phage protein